MLNIVIPMAGLGSRFTAAGYMTPKPLIPLHGVPMIKVVIDNLAPKRPHRFIFIVQKAWLDEYGMEVKLKSFSDSAEVIAINYITEGQVCTALLGKKFFNNDEPLMTANCDQYVDVDINDYLEDMDRRKLDGLIMTMKATDPKWSYAKTDSSGLVLETAEKKAISPDATVGIFNFRHGSDLVRSAERMIANDLRVNNEFYTCPCYNYLVKEGKRIGIYPIGQEGDGMYGLGIPADLEYFINHPVSRKIKGAI